MNGNNFAQTTQESFASLWGFIFFSYWATYLLGLHDGNMHITPGTFLVICTLSTCAVIGMSVLKMRSR